MRGLTWGLVGLVLIATGGLSGTLPAADEPQKSPLDALAERIEKAGLADKPFGLLVSLKVREDKLDAFLAVAKTAQAASRKEPGCSEYTFHQGVESPTDVYVTEKWKNLGALKEHFASQHFQSMAGQLGDLLQGSPQIRVIREVQ